jgi:ABC-type transport system involved in multi-copper enzyme maturation permease subunit
VILLIGWNLFSAVLGQMSIRETQRVARDLGLAGTSLIGCIAAIVLGAFLLVTEVQRRTIHAIVSKPIERWEFVVGKYTGMALVLSLLVGLFSAVLVGVLTLYGAGVSAALARALLLAWMEVMTVASIAILFSTFSTPILSAVFAAGMWMIGRVTPDIIAATKASAAWIRGTARVALEIVPDMSLYAPSGGAVDGSTVSIHSDFVTWSYVATAGAHAAGWIVGLLAIACLVFHRRDFA